MPPKPTRSPTKRRGACLLAVGCPFPRARREVQVKISAVLGRVPTVLLGLAPPPVQCLRPCPAFLSALCSPVPSLPRFCWEANSCPSALRSSYLGA